jgi:hypothetical protein
MRYSKHAPGSEPGKRAPGAGSHTASSKTEKEGKFTALLHHISPEHLEAALFGLKEIAASGVEGVTWRAYAESLDVNILELHSRLHKGAYRALPSRRVDIPKPDRRQCPLAVAALEDKIVNGRLSESWTRSTRRTSSGSRTDSDRSAPA